MNGSVECRFTTSMPAGEIPSEFQLFPYGLVEIEGSAPFRVDETIMARVIERFKARRLDMVIDYEHQTEGGQYASPDGTAPAAGWIKRLINRGKEGLWAGVEWTQKAKGLLGTKEYRYFSPVFHVTKNDRHLADLLRVALTNAPRLNGIRPIMTKRIESPPDPLQLEINRMTGVTDEAWEKYGPKPVSAPSQHADPLQLKINSMLGVTEEAWEKYGPAQSGR